MAVFCLTTGAVLDAALGRGPGKRTGEAALLRDLAGGFGPGDVVLADRLYGSFYDLTGWVARGVDVVVWLHQPGSPTSGPAGNWGAGRPQSLADRRRHQLARRDPDRGSCDRSFGEETCVLGPAFLGVVRAEIHDAATAGPVGEPDVRLVGLWWR